VPVLVREPPQIARRTLGMSRELLVDCLHGCCSARSNRYSNHWTRTIGSIHSRIVSLPALKRVAIESRSRHAASSYQNMRSRMLSMICVVSLLTSHAIARGDINGAKAACYDMTPGQDHLFVWLFARECSSRRVKMNCHCNTPGALSASAFAV
jgi:hypothetical protein